MSEVSAPTRPATAARLALQAQASVSARRPWFDLNLTGDWLMDTQALWYLSAAWHGAADIGEVLRAASHIISGDELSWHRAWWAAAERVAWAGTRSLAAGHERSAGQAYLRASTYYRAAELFHQPAHAGLLDAARNGQAYFVKALGLLGVPMRPVSIPYESSRLPGYFFQAQAAGRPAPILIFHQGYHAWVEESLYVAYEALARGWHCLMFSGPGQGMVIREQGLPFRPDWEKVVGPVVDFGLAQPDVDPDRIGLIGLSLGGALAARAAAYEPRLKVCVTNPGVLSWREAMYEQIAAFDPGLPALVDSDPEAFNAAIAEVMGQSSGARWFISEGVWKYGAASPADFMRRLRDYDNRACAGRIRCRMLVMDGTAESASPGQARKLYEALECPKYYLLFTDEEAASLHCQNGALAASGQQMFDWLEDNL